MAISPTETTSSVTAPSTLSPSLPRGSEGFQKSLIGQNATLEKPVTNPPSQPAAKPDTRPNPTRSHIERNVTHKTGGLHQRRLQAVNSAAGGFMSYGQFMVEMGLKTSLVAGENAKTDLRGTMLSNELMQSLSPRAQQYLIQEKTTGSIRESARHVYSPITGANGPESHYKVIIQAIRVAKHMTHEDMLQGSNINPPGQNIGESLRPHYPGAGERVSGGLTTEQRYPGIGSLTHTEAYRELTINNQTVWIRPPSHNGTADTVAPNYSVMYREASGKVQEQILGGSGSWEGAARLAKAFLGAGADTAKTSTATTKPDTAPVPQAVQVAPKSTLNQVIDEAVSTVPQAQQSSVTQALRETFKQNNITRPQQAQSYISQLTPGSETLGQLTQKAHQIEAQAQTPMNPGSRNTAVPIMQDGKPIGAIPGKPGEIIQFAKASKTAADEIQIHAPGDTPGKRPADLYDEKTPFSTTLPEAKPTGDAQPTDALANPNTLEAKPIGDGNLLRPTGNGQAAEIDLGHARPEFMPTNGQSHVKTGQALQSTVNIDSPEEALPQRAPVELTPVIKAPKAGTPNTVVASQSGPNEPEEDDKNQDSQQNGTEQPSIPENTSGLNEIDEKLATFNTVIKSQQRFPGQTINLSGQSWTGMNLAGTNLESSLLKGTSFAGSNLRSSNLFGADLSEANLNAANLSFADMGHTTLRRAVLASANLKGTDLQGANLEQASLPGADLHGANLKSANFQGANLQGADLRRATLDQRTLISNVNFSGANLRGLNFSRMDLRGTDLSGADLSGADLRNAILDGVNLEGANLTETKLQGAHLNKANLREANFDNAVFGARTQLKDANLQGANLQNQKLRGMNLQGINLSMANLKNADLIGANLRDARLSGANLTQAALVGADLNGANLTSAHLEGANLRSAILVNVKFTQAFLVKADLSKTFISGSYFNDANLTLADLNKSTVTSNFSGADLAMANLSDADLSYSNFQTANMNNANLQNSDLSLANLREANLDQAQLSRADLDGAKLQNAVLTRTDLSHANLINAFFSNTNLRGANLTQAEYTLADLINNALIDDSIRNSQP